MRSLHAKVRGDAVHSWPQHTTVCGGDNLQSDTEEIRDFLMIMHSQQWKIWDSTQMQIVCFGYDTTLPHSNFLQTSEGLLWRTAAV